MRFFIFYSLILTSCAVIAKETSHADAEIGIQTNGFAEGSSGVSPDAATALSPPSYDFEGMLDKGDTSSILTREQDFWEVAKKSEKTLRDYAVRLLEGAAAYFDSPDFTDVLSTMNDIVNTTASFRVSISVALDAHNLTLNMLTEELQGIFTKISDDLQTAASPDEAPGHAERAELVNRTLDIAIPELVKLFTRLGVEEDVVELFLTKLRQLLSRLITIVGDIHERCPLLLTVIIFSIMILLIPQMWLLMPLLSLFGFGPAGPVMGSTAALLQSVFFGGAVKAGSWFALLQAAGMGTLPTWGWIAGLIIKAPFLVGSLGWSMLSCYNRV